MSRLAERALFFGAGLSFGVLVGMFLGGGVSSERETAPTPRSRAAETAPPPPAGEPGEPDRARLDAALAAVEARPDDAGARAAVGALHLEARDFREALYWFQQARNLDPRDLGIRSRLAFARLGLGQVEAAVAEYRTILEEDPEHLESLVALGRIRLFVEQDMEAGIALWERAVAAAPDSPEAAALRSQLEALRTAHPPGSD